MNQQRATILTVIALCLAAGPISANDNAGKMEGEVVEFRHGVSLENGGEFDQVMLRTRDGATHRLLLGETETCENCVAIGDRVRARVVRGDSQAEPGRVRTMRVRRTGERFEFRDESGNLLRTTTRSRDRLRTETGAADGVHRRARTESRGTGAGYQGQQGGGSGGGGRQR